jgi:large subunit ribosomal protein L13
MIDRSPLGRQQMSNLRVYAGENHPHVAQTPRMIDFASQNRKNVKSKRSA